MVVKVDRKYLNQLKLRYKKSRKLQKKIILDEFTNTLGYERKHAIKLLNGKYRYITRVIHKHHKIYTKEDADILGEVRLRFMSLLVLRELEPGYPTLYWDWILIQVVNSSMPIFTGIA